MVKTNGAKKNNKFLFLFLLFSNLVYSQDKVEKAEKKEISELKELHLTKKNNSALLQFTFIKFQPFTIPIFEISKSKKNLQITLNNSSRSKKQKKNSVFNNDELLDQLKIQDDLPVKGSIQVTVYLKKQFDYTETINFKNNSLEISFTPKLKEEPVESPYPPVTSGSDLASDKSDGFNGDTDHQKTEITSSETNGTQKTGTKYLPKIRIITFSCLGLGLAGIGLGIFSKIKAKNASDNLKATDEKDIKEINKWEKETNKWNTLLTSGFITGGIFLFAGGTLYFRFISKDSESTFLDIPINLDLAENGQLFFTYKVKF